MKTIQFKKIFALIACFISVMYIYADSFKINGLSYETEGNQAFVTGYDTSQGENVIIPASVSNAGVTYSVTKICCLAFYSHHGVKSVHIPNTVTTIEGSAFLYAGLTRLTIPKSVTEIGKCAFMGCSSLKSINVENGNPKYDSRENCNAIIETERDELFQGCQNTFFPSSIKSIADMAFYMCNCPKDLVIPDNIGVIGDRAFCDCNMLQSVILGTGLTFIGGIQTFGGCSSLKTVTSLAEEPPGVWSESCFDSIAYETAILCVPAEFLNSYKAANCWQKFKTIASFYEYDFEVGGVFYKIINNGEVIVVNNHGCINSYSGSVVIPETVTHNGVTYSVTGIGDLAFAYCGSLTSLTIPVTISSIGSDAFAGASIQFLFITGNGVWTAGALNLRVDKLFFDCGVTAIEGMKIEAADIYSFALVPPICDEYTFTCYDDALHVPPTSFAAYFTADYWSYFINITGDADFVKPTSIQLSQSNALLEIGEEITLSATVNPTETSFKTVYWSSTNENVATVNDNGVITALSVGECDIIATSLTVMAKCHIVVVEKKIYITLDQHTAEVLPNHMVTLTPALSPISTDIVVTSSDLTVAAARLANGKIQVVGIKEGTATITVNSVDGYALPDSCIVTVYTERGDVNCDGFINVSDVTSLINYVLSDDASSIKEDNADLNNDGFINISDVTTMINLVLKQSSAVYLDEIEIDGATYKVSLN